jgi:hypothetical protein
MNSTPSKTFILTVLNCENPSHARKIAELLHASFPHALEHVKTDEPASLTVMLQADNLDSIKKVISPALGKAHPIFCHSMRWVSGEAETSETPTHIQFAPPLRSPPA